MHPERKADLVAGADPAVVDAVAEAVLAAVEAVVDAAVVAVSAETAAEADLTVRPAEAIRARSREHRASS